MRWVTRSPELNVDARTRTVCRRNAVQKRKGKVRRRVDKCPDRHRRRPIGDRRSFRLLRHNAISVFGKSFMCVLGPSRRPNIHSVIADRSVAVDGGVDVGVDGASLAGIALRLCVPSESTYVSYRYRTGSAGRRTGRRGNGAGPGPIAAPPGPPAHRRPRPHRSRRRRLDRLLLRWACPSVEIQSPQEPSSEFTSRILLVPQVTAFIRTITINTTYLTSPFTVSTTASTHSTVDEKPGGCLLLCVRQKR